MHCIISLVLSLSLTTFSVAISPMVITEHNIKQRLFNYLENHKTYEKNVGA
jgi:hypothetical protein